MDFDKPKVYGDTSITDGLVTIGNGVWRVGGVKFANRWQPPPPLCAAPSPGDKTSLSKAATPR